METASAQMCETTAQLCQAPDREATSKKGDVPAIIEETKNALSTFENGAGPAGNLPPAPPYRENAPVRSTLGVVQGNGEKQIAIFDFASQLPFGGVSASSSKRSSDISSQGYLESQASTSSENFEWNQHANSTRGSLSILNHGSGSALPLAGEEPGRYTAGSTISISTDESRPNTASRQIGASDEVGEGINEPMHQPVEPIPKPSTPLPMSVNHLESARGNDIKEPSSEVVAGMKMPHRQSALDACLGRGRKTAPPAVGDLETGTYEEILEDRGRWHRTRVVSLRLSIVVGVLSVVALVILLALSKDKAMTRASLTGCSLVFDTAIIVGMAALDRSMVEVLMAGIFGVLVPFFLTSNIDTFFGYPA